MAYAVRDVTCTDCGRPMHGRYRPRPPWRCWECADARMVEAIRQQREGTHWSSERAARQGHILAEQIARKRGPRYEKWVRNIEAWRPGASGATPPGKTSGKRAGAKRRTA